MKQKEKVLMGLMAICFLVASASIAGPGVGDPAPNFTLPDSANRNRSLSDYTPGHNKVVMLNFWASW